MKTINIANKRLLPFIKGAKLHLNNIDEIMKLPEGRIRDETIAKEMNRFNLDLDMFLHFGLNVPLDKLQSVLNENFKL